MQNCRTVRGRCRYARDAAGDLPACPATDMHRWHCAIDRLCAVMLEHVAADPALRDSRVHPEYIPYGAYTDDVLQTMFDRGANPAHRRVSPGLPSPWRVYPDQNANEFVRDVVFTAREDAPERFADLDAQPVPVRNYAAMLERLPAADRRRLSKTLARWRDWLAAEGLAVPHAATPPAEALHLYADALGDGGGP
jgi:hypothetical protein